MVLPQPKGLFFFLPLSAKVAVGTQRELKPLWLWYFPQPKGLFFFLPLSAKVAVGTQRELKPLWLWYFHSQRGSFFFQWLWELNVDSSPFGCGNFQSEGGSLFCFLTTEPLTELDVNLAWEISTARGFFFLSHDRATQLWERGLSFTLRNFEPEPICTRTGFRNPFKNVAGEISHKGRKHKTAGSYGS